MNWHLSEKTLILRFAFNFAHVIILLIAFNSHSLAFTTLSFRDLPHLYDIIGGSL